MIYHDRLSHLRIAYPGFAKPWLGDYARRIIRRPAQDNIWSSYHLWDGYKRWGCVLLPWMRNSFNMSTAHSPNTCEMEMHGPLYSPSALPTLRPFILLPLSPPSPLPLCITPQGHQLHAFPLTHICLEMSHPLIYLWSFLYREMVRVTNYLIKYALSWI